MNEGKPTNKKSDWTLPLNPIKSTKKPFVYTLKLDNQYSMLTNESDKIVVDNSKLTNVVHR